MSTIITDVQTSNQLNSNYNTEKIALGNNEFVEAQYTATGNVTLAEGLVFGRIASTQKVVPVDKDATDGSQYPLGVLYNGLGGSKVVANGATVTLTLIVKGDVNGGLLTFASGTTISSDVDDILLEDRIIKGGITIKTITQLSGYDN